ncbi:MAG: indole-3-glycerol phosphate synthase TrpC [Lachnospiraceae bacterium]|nr:indole-3-glycerol phosphate synthase TrpC [Lachnospiraceae bacterium]
MENILEKIAKTTRKRIADAKEQCSMSMLQTQVEQQSEEEAAPSFFNYLQKPGISFICEVKKASPSKGLIAPQFPYLEIAKAYEEAGASAISCLTEPYYFQGADRYLSEIAGEVQIPVLRKDFTIDPYMVYQAKLFGASAILLICSILEDRELESYRQLAEQLGMDALVEAHDDEEVRRAVASGARIIGVNNRNLKNFEVDFDNTLRLRQMVPKDTLFVSESGIKTPEHIASLRNCGVDAVLIGETLMRASDKKAMLETLNGGKL